MKICIVGILLCLVARIGVAQDRGIIADTLALRLSVYTEGGEALEKIHAYRSILSGKKNAASEEDILACENILLTEICNFSPPDSDTKRSLYRALRAQKDTCEVYMREHKKPGIYFLTSFGDITVRLLEFIASGDMIQESMKAKQLYTQALKIDKKFPYALTGYALWQYFAPPIAGGGYNAALGTFNKVLQYAKTEGDKYFGYLYRSQLYFVMGRKTESAADLAAAHALVPGESFTATLREQNAQGKTLFN
jgi:hypothetical protein